MISRLRPACTDPLFTVHVEEFKKELTREVLSMTQEVTRLQRERQALEQQIADLFAFYAKQKQANEVNHSETSSNAVMTPSLSRVGRRKGGLHRKAGHSPTPRDVDRFQVLVRLGRLQVSCEGLLSYVNAWTTVVGVNSKVHIP